MKKRLLALILSLSLMSMCGTGCSEDSGAGATDTSVTAAESEIILSQKETVVFGTEEILPETTENEYDTTSSVNNEPVSAESFGRGSNLSLTPDGELEITRMSSDNAGAAVPNDGIWTVFVFLCGSDLETNGNYATNDIEEMKEATAICPNLRFVVEAGGSKDWENLEDGKNTRFLISDGTISESTVMESADMGDPNNLVKFLDWGLTNYASQYMAVDLWNHGGGCVGGVCYDEIYSYNCLSVTEMDAAFAAVYDKHGIVFDLVGFDACNMGTIEVANMLVPYSEYMIASQEYEPGTGWEYTGFSDKAANGAEQGKYITDAYFNSFSSETAAKLTMAVIDLSKVDVLLKTFNRHCSDVYDYICRDNVNDVVVASKQTIGFGGNMIDLKNFITATAGYSTRANDAVEKLESCVVYVINGSEKSRAGGLNVYYPFHSDESSEINYVKNVCITPYYLGIIDICSYAGANTGSISGYDTTQWIDENSGFWSEAEVDESEYGYWDNKPEPMALSHGNTTLSFEVEPYIKTQNGLLSFIFGSDDYYSCMLSTESMDTFLKAVVNVYQTYSDATNGKEYYLSYGSDVDVYIDKETREFKETSPVYWISLPDGQHLCTNVESWWLDPEAEYKEYSIVYNYTTPVIYNGKYANATLERRFTGYGSGFEYFFCGVLEEDSASGSSRLIELKEGDVIVPRYPAYNKNTLEYECDFVGTEYKVSQEGIVKLKSNQFFNTGNYGMSMTFYDIYDNYFSTYIAPYYLKQSSDGNKIEEHYFIQ